ncbi:Myb-like_DNA-binding domain-containing protein [Hexamita inflata]|uniref:Myb-like DNA-binding domain-containing protein n=1 Tax=Hexamita inflata TaxID=28002 RepID=A0AA86NLV0_9EUKA|nr:Myb-like DNA-binding domain-containing protein [Hexamita inflata]
MKNNYQRSDVNCLQWSQSDIQLLIEAQKLQGNNWTYICRHYFPNRSANQVKCKYNYLERKEQKQGQQIQEQLVCLGVVSTQLCEEESCLLYLPQYSFYLHE